MLRHAGHAGHASSDAARQPLAATPVALRPAHPVAQRPGRATGLPGHRAIAAHAGVYPDRCPATIRASRSRCSGEYLSKEFRPDRVRTVYTVPGRRQ